jgi:hypothetical protein
MDRLTEIEEKYRLRMNGSDIDWLIAEVKRLRQDKARLARVADSVINRRKRKRIPSQAPVRVREEIDQATAAARMGDRGN